MFELGLRLAFDNPTVIVKDDKTDYSFDAGVIENIPYPRDLRFTKIVEFKKKLAEKVSNTFKASVEDPKHVRRVAKEFYGTWMSLASPMRRPDEQGSDTPA